MEGTPGNGARILLVDDQPDQLEMYHLALTHAGFAVEQAATGTAALAQVRRAPPDLIVLDLRLPDISGWDVCRQLKASDETAHIPIVILTAAASLRLADQAAAAGCAAHLVKPCYPDHLIRTLRQVLAAA